MDRIVGDEFGRGARLQGEWSWQIATAFFFGEVGAGLFLASLVFDSVSGMAWGVLLTAVGKTTGHLLHLGQPLRAWRAIVRLRSSWVSRGLLAIVLFTGFGAAYVLCRAELTFGLIPKSLAPLYAAIAVAAAVVVALYQGLAMSHSSAIALWNTGLLPMIGLTYALLAGVSLLLAAAQLPDLALAKYVALALLAYAFLSVLCLLHGAKYGPKGAAQSAELVVQGGLTGWFTAVVLGAGFIVPALLLAFGTDGANLEFSAACVLIGYYAFRVLLLRAGLYDPIQSFTGQARRP